MAGAVRVAGAAGTAGETGATGATGAARMMETLGGRLPCQLFLVSADLTFWSLIESKTVLETVMSLEIDTDILCNHRP